MADIKTLAEVLTLEFGKKTLEKVEIPQTIIGNLNPKFPIRPYQNTAFKLALTYFDPEGFDGKPKHNHQLLFHMATGSGKTLMMAGVMLYLYEQGYRNFLFFVNSTNIIDKTKDNFLNKCSSKYLFSESINIKDKQVFINEVENFQAGKSDDINIVFSTIQGLHMDLNTPKENSLTYDDFENQKIVLISDEAHHINADTKKGKSQLSQEELFEIVSWEGTIERLFKANPQNILLEFTATMDLSDVNLAEKYKPKLIFDYPLREFRADGYSKEVKVLQVDLPPIDRAIQAILLSQFRRKVFEKNKFHIKPVILFKSKTIKENSAFFEEFRNGIKLLNPNQLEAIKAKATDLSIINAFDYFEANNISLDNLVLELQEDFADEKLITVDHTSITAEKQLTINSLEDESNETRAVFAVDQLNEGWDVLNLFDIVRLYNTRDAKANKVGKTTMSEAQLIGRGARYCPFQTSVDQPLYERKFDSDLDNELRVCEELYYHCEHNPKYIQELNTALREIGIKAKNTSEKQLKLKPTFKETSLYKAGLIFLNEKVKYKREDITGLDSTLITKTHKVTLRTGYAKSTVAFDAAPTAGVAYKSKDYDLLSFGENIIRKAIQRLELYEFSTLKKYLPNLKSIHEFITSDMYLGKVKLEVSGLPSQIDNLSADEKLDAALQILDSIANVIASDKVEYKGTKAFKPYMIKDKFIDKTLSFAIDDDSDKEFGKSMMNATETAIHLDLSSRDWYVFDDCFGTSEEKLLIKYIDKRHSDLQKKYSDIYLIRNERHFQLFNFDDGQALEPDFLLYLIGKNGADTMHYQVFVEPKGGHLLKQDEWKENFLKSIKANGKIEQLWASNEYDVLGMPFFNSELRMEEFDEGFNALV